MFMFYYIPKATDTFQKLERAGDRVAHIRALATGRSHVRLPCGVNLVETRSNPCFSLGSLVGVMAYHCMNHTH